MKKKENETTQNIKSNLVNMAENRIIAFKQYII